MSTSIKAGRKSANTQNRSLAKNQTGLAAPVFGKIGIPALAAVLAIRSGHAASHRLNKRSGKR